MLLSGLQHVDRFKEKHPRCARSLSRVQFLLESAQIQTPIDLKKIFGGNVDFVGRKTVIDIGGNKARMILVISYRNGMGIIEAVLTHEEYDRNNWKD